jgi:hypothetical protein
MYIRRSERVIIWDIRMYIAKSERVIMRNSHAIREPKAVLEQTQLRDANHLEIPVASTRTTGMLSKIGESQWVGKHGESPLHFRSEKTP